MPGLLEVEFKPGEIARVKKSYERFRGLPLRGRMAKATLKAGDMLVPYIRAASPVGPPRDPNHGYLKRSAKSRPAKERFGGTLQATLGVLVGPTSPVRHLNIRGHRIVTPGGRDTGARTKPNPYVDRAVSGRIDEAKRIVSQIFFGP